MLSTTRTLHFCGIALFIDKTPRNFESKGSTSMFYFFGNKTAKTEHLKKRRQTIGIINVLYHRIYKSRGNIGLLRKEPEHFFIRLKSYRAYHRGGPFTTTTLFNG